MDVRGRLSTVPTDYAALVVTSKKLTQSENSYLFGVSASKKRKTQMPIAGIAVFFIFLQSLITRSKEISSLHKSVTGPLTEKLKDECVSKIILLLVFGGRALDLDGRLFDGTKEYPGEDVQL